MCKHTFNCHVSVSTLIFDWTAPCALAADSLEVCKWCNKIPADQGGGKFSWKKQCFCVACGINCNAPHLHSGIQSLGRLPDCLLLTLQVSRYDFSAPGWKSGSGLFTQMVWRNTKAIGCAANTACTWTMYVCHYSPPGALGCLVSDRWVSGHHADLVGQKDRSLAAQLAD